MRHETIRDVDQRTPQPRRRRLDLAGVRFGMLVARCPVARDKWRNVIWLCDCDCGETVNVRAGRLSSGPRPTTTCGCRRTRRAA